MDLTVTGTCATIALFLDFYHKDESIVRDIYLGLGLGVLVLRQGWMDDVLGWEVVSSWSELVRVGKSYNDGILGCIGEKFTCGCSTGRACSIVVEFVGDLVVLHVHLQV